jgi:hypothetical protein
MCGGNRTCSGCALFQALPVVGSPQKPSAEEILTLSGAQFGPKFTLRKQRIDRHCPQRDDNNF